MREMKVRALLIVLLLMTPLVGFAFIFRPKAAEVSLGSGTLYSKTTFLSVSPYLSLVNQPPTSAFSSNPKRSPLPISRLVYLKKGEGDVVKKGEKFAELDGRLLNAFTEKVEANFDIAVATRELLESKRDEVASAAQKSVSARSKLFEARSSAISSFTTARRTATRVETNLSSKLSALSARESQLKDGLERLEVVRGRARAALRAALALPPSPQKKLALAKASAALKKIESKKSFLKKGLTEIIFAQSKISGARSAIGKGLSAGEQKLSAGLQKISSGLSKITSARRKLREARRELDFRIEAVEHKIKALKKAVDAAKAIQGRNQIVSNADGRVLDLRLGEGETVFPGQHIAEIADISNLFVKLYIPYAELSSITKEEKVLIGIDGFPNLRFKGKIDNISNVVEFAPTNLESNALHLLRVLPVTVKVKNVKGILKPGLPADVFLERS